jgi:protoporphyrin/coproporphyrin ferrochelatase
MRVGVILATYGEPRENGFAAQWMYSYRILRGLTRKIAPVPAALFPIIATARALNRVKLWREHQFGSPLEPVHEQTVALVEERLAERFGNDVRVVAGYEFRRPDLSDAVRRLKELACEHAVVVPMYIAEGDFTHGMTRIGIDDALARTGWERRRLTMCSMTENEFWEDRLATTLAEHLLDVLRGRGVSSLGDYAVLLAAHGTVVTPVPGVDNGLEHFGRVLHRIKTKVRPHFGLVRVGWLNHTRGGEWTSPPVTEALATIREHGYDRLVYFPWGFTTDNAETALEVRVALAGMANPFPSVEYIECMNTREPFIRLLAERISDHIAQVDPSKREAAFLSV